MSEILAHERVHSILMKNTTFGRIQLTLSAFALPPWPSGVVRRRAARLLALTIRASTRVQEGCASFVGSYEIGDSDRAAFWQRLPAAYREAAKPLDWISESRLSPGSRQSLAAALAEFALSIDIDTQWVPAGLADADRLDAYLNDMYRNPDQRFDLACERASELSLSRLREIASSPPQAVQRLADYCVTKDAGLTYSPPQLQPRVTSTAYVDWLRSLVKNVAAGWIADPSLLEPERERLQMVLHNEPVTMLTVPQESVLSAVVTRTAPVPGGIADYPDVEQLLQYEYAGISWNRFAEEVPGVELTDKQPLLLREGEAAMWLESRLLPPVACRLSEDQITEYLKRAKPETTLVFYDGTYSFSDGDLLGPPVVRDRPHCVLVQQRTLGTLLDDLSMVTFAGEKSGLYCEVGSEYSGAAFLVFRPAKKQYPIVVAPVPVQSARRAAEMLNEVRWEVRWREVQGPEAFIDEVLGNDPVAIQHVLRVLAEFDGKAWPPNIS